MLTRTDLEERNAEVMREIVAMTRRIHQFWSVVYPPDLGQRDLLFSIERHNRKERVSAIIRNAHVIHDMKLDNVLSRLLSDMWKASHGTVLMLDIGVGVERRTATPIEVEQFGAAYGVVPLDNGYIDPADRPAKGYANPVSEERFD